MKAASASASAPVSPHAGAMMQLPQSTRSNPSSVWRTTAPTLIAAAGFGQVRYRNLSMGIAALHSAWKL